MQQRVYVVSTTNDDTLREINARVGAASRAGLRPIQSARWQDADQRYLGYNRETLDQVVEARRLAEEGRSQFANLELDEAVETLRASVAAFDSTVAAIEDPSDLGTALLYLGASLAYNGDERGAREVFQRLHIQMPHIVPDPDIFPPEVVERYEQAAPPHRVGTLEVNSDPEGAIAYVDFVPRGRTPVTLDNIPAGQHVVRTVVPGATPYVEQINVRPRRTVGVSSFLIAQEGMENVSRATDELAEHSLEQGDGPIAELGQALEVDKLAVIRVSAGDTPETVNLELTMFDVATGARVLRGQVVAPVALGELEPVVQASVQAAIENALRPRTSGQGEPQRAEEEVPWQQAPPEEASSGSKWWLWTIIGVAAAAAIGVGLYFILRDTGPEQTPGGAVVFEF